MEIRVKAIIASVFVLGVIIGASSGFFASQPTLVKENIVVSSPQDDLETVQQGRILCSALANVPSSFVVPKTSLGLTRVQNTTVGHVVFTKLAVNESFVPRFWRFRLALLEKITLPSIVHANSLANFVWVLLVGDKLPESALKELDTVLSRAKLFTLVQVISPEEFLAFSDFPTVRAMIQNKFRGTPLDDVVRNSDILLSSNMDSDGANSPVTLKLIYFSDAVHLCVPLAILYSAVEHRRDYYPMRGYHVRFGELWRVPFTEKDGKLGKYGTVWRRLDRAAYTTKSGKIFGEGCFSAFQSVAVHMRSQKQSELHLRAGIGHYALYPLVKRACQTKRGSCNVFMDGIIGPAVVWTRTMTSATVDLILYRQRADGNGTDAFESEYSRCGAQCVQEFEQLLGVPRENMLEIKNVATKYARGDTQKADGMFSSAKKVGK